MMLNYKILKSLKRKSNREFSLENGGKQQIYFTLENMQVVHKHMKRHLTS